MKPEPHCNCPHCQVARSLHEEENEQERSEEIDLDQEVKDDELHFQEWEIEQKGDHLFSVTHRLDQKSYNVYLGDPIGCTCGQEKCEHVKVALQNPL